MNHPYYDQPNSFTPSKSTLNTWLKTRKSNTPSKPGVFETVDYTRDTTWAIITILIETSALVLTLWGAYKVFQENGVLTYLYSAIVLVLLFITFDIIGILLHSYDKPSFVRTKNEIVLTTNPVALQQLYDLEGTISWRTFLGFILLILSGGMKVVAISIYWSDSNAGILASIVLSILYLITIYIHLYHTSYWFSAISTNKKIKNEYKKHMDSISRGTTSVYVVNPTQYIFSSPFFMPMNHFQNGRQSIQFNQTTTINGVQLHNYTLISVGCLWDDDITSMTMFFNPNFNADLIKACIHLQFIQLGSPIIPTGAQITPTTAT